MKEKSEVCQIFKELFVLIQNQFQTSIQAFKTDNRREFFFSNLGDFLKSKGIIHLSSCVDTPQQNGVAKRKNRHLLEITRYLLFESNAPDTY